MQIQNNRFQAPKGLTSIPVSKLSQNSEAPQEPNDPKEPKDGFDPVCTQVAKTAGLAVVGATYGYLYLGLPGAALGVGAAVALGALDYFTRER